MYKRAPYKILAGVVLLALAATAVYAASLKKRKLAGKINDNFSFQAAPAIAADRKSIFYMVRDPKDKKNNVKNNWDLWYAERKGKRWGKGKPISILNSDYFEGYPSVTADGRFMYFVANSAKALKDGKLVQDLDIYFSQKINGKWTKAKRLPEGINFKGTDESGASISPDGSRLVFFSELGINSRGGFDIYIAERDGTGKWKLAENMGGPVNTDSNETTPYLAPDGKTLYFSSDRKGGYGGYDFYKSEYKNGRWTKPRNLGKGVNTKGSDLGLSIAGNSEDVYLSGQDKYNTWNLYKAKLPPKAQPKKILLIATSVRNKKSKKPIKADVIVEDLDSGKYLGTFQTEPKTGKTTLTLVEGRKYSVTIQSKGFMLLTDNFDLKKVKKYTEARFNWELAPMEVGQTIVLKNVFFRPGSAALTKQSRLALDKLTKILVNYKNLHLEIGGHTDRVGTQKANQALSEKRAASVLAYLLKKGLGKNRFKAKGYGSTKPLSTNKTKAGRQMNRRTEFTIIKK